MAEEVTNFFVASKFVDSKSLDKTLMSDDIYVVDSDHHKYWPFKPKHMNDFDNNNTKYGAIKDGNMNYLKIVKLCENFEDLGYGRISIPKRWSFGVGSEPLTAFRFVAEGEASSRSAPKKSKLHKDEKVNKSNTEPSNVPKSVQLVTSTGENPKPKKNRREKHAHHNQEEKKDKPQDEKKDKQNNKKEHMKPESKHHKEEIMKMDPHHLDKNKKKTSGNLFDMSGDEGHVNLHKSGERNKAAGVNQYFLDLQKNSALETPMDEVNQPVGNVTVHKEAKEPCLKCVDLEVDIEDAKRMIDNLNDKLDEYRSQLNEANETIKELNEKLANEEVMSKKEMYDLLQANLKGTFISDQNFLKTETFLVEHRLKDSIEVPEGKVYCGNGIIVSKADLFDTAKATSFGRRVARIIDVMYEGETHQHFLSGVAQRAPPSLKVFKITDNEVRAIKKILRALPGWENLGNVDISTSNICTSIKNYTSQCLTTYLRDSGLIAKPPRKRNKVSRKTKRSESDSSAEESSNVNVVKKSKISDPQEPETSLKNAGSSRKKNRSSSSGSDTEDGGNEIQKNNRNGHGKESGSTSSESVLG